MGIAGLWDVLGDGEIVSIADYAARHFEKHNRPLRIAVDEAGWRFNNLTPEQAIRKGVPDGRKGVPEANPIEKTVLWRALPLLRLNVQLLFVFDGAQHPYKFKSDGRRRGGEVEYDKTKVLKELLRHLKIPYHQAPGEAEAECAKLQRLDIVDTVWSDDGDTLMFGATSLIKQHKVGKNRIDGHIRVYTAQHIFERFMMDADSLVLFAVLAGRDYDMKGLPRCGPQKIRKFATVHMGVAKSLRQAGKNDMPAWRETLAQGLRGCGGMVEIPSDFPYLKALEGYRNPAVSTDEQLQHLRGLRQGWYRPIDQPKLRVLIRQKYNMWTRGYLKHVAPIFLVQALLEPTTEEQQLHNMRYDVQLKRVRKKKAADGESDDQPQIETKITFAPLPAVEIDLSQEPEGEDWSVWAGKDKSHYDPAAPVETTVLSIFLKYGLPEGAIIPPPSPQTRKRKAREERDGNGQAAAPRASGPSKKRKSKSTTELDEAALDSAEEPRAQKRPRKSAKASDAEGDQTEPVQAKKRRTKKKSKDPTPSPPPRPSFRLPPGPPPGLLIKRHSDIVDLMSDSEDDIGDPSLFVSQDSASSILNRAVENGDSSQEAAHPASTATPANSISSTPSIEEVDEGARPGESFAADKLRALRAAAFLVRTASSATEATTASTPLVPVAGSPVVKPLSVPPKAHHEVIDLI